MASRRFLKLGVGLATTEGRMSSPCVGRRRLGEIGRPPGRGTRAYARAGAGNEELMRAGGNKRGRVRAKRSISFRAGEKERGLAILESPPSRGKGGEREREEGGGPPGIRRRRRRLPLPSRRVPCSLLVTTSAASATSATSVTARPQYHPRP